jgi:hypothetical protein
MNLGWLRWRRLVIGLCLFRWRRLGIVRWRLVLLNWRRLGLRGRYDLNAHNRSTTLAAYLLHNLFGTAAHHFDCHRVLLLVVYLVMYFSRSQNSTPHPQKKTQSFSFSLC